MRKFIALFLLTTPLFAASREPVIAKHGIVASTSEIASRVGVEVLKKGGNAVDAAVATALAMAVTWPSAGNIGGGGFMLVYPPKGEPTLIEYRETAPLAASKTMYVKGDGRLTHKAVGVPGTVRGLYLAHQKYGKLPWKDLVLPAIQLAEDGFKLNTALARSLNNVVDTSAEFPELRRVLGKAGGQASWKE